MSPINSLTGKQEMSFEGVAVDLEGNQVSREMEEWLRIKDNEEIANYLRKKKSVIISLIVIIPIFAFTVVSILK